MKITAFTPKCIVNDTYGVILTEIYAVSQKCETHIFSVMVTQCLQLFYGTYRNITELFFR